MDRIELQHLAALSVVRDDQSDRLAQGISSQDWSSITLPYFNASDSQRHAMFDLTCLVCRILRATPMFRETILR